MTTLHRIDPATFQISNPDHSGRMFTYWMFVREAQGGYANYWDIVGLSQHHMPPLTFLRLLHIEEELREMEEFEALVYGQGFVSLDPDDLLAFITFLEEMIVPTSEASPAGTEHYFHRLSENDLRLLHFKPYWQQYYAGYCYQYQPPEETLARDMIMLVTLPHWSDKHGRNQLTSLSVLAFRGDQLRDPTFDPLRQREIATIAFDRGALEAFVTILKQYRYRS